MLETQIRIHGPIMVMGQTEYVVNQDTIEVDDDGVFERFVSRHRLGVAKHPITLRDVTSDLERYGKIADWR